MEKVTDPRLERCQKRLSGESDIMCCFPLKSYPRGRILLGFHFPTTGCTRITEQVQNFKIYRFFLKPSQTSISLSLNPHWPTYVSSGVTATLRPHPLFVSVEARVRIFGWGALFQLGWNYGDFLGLRSPVLPCGTEATYKDIQFPLCLYQPSLGSSLLVLIVCGWSLGNANEGDFKTLGKCT